MAESSSDELEKRDQNPQFDLTPGSKKHRTSLQKYRKFLVQENGDPLIFYMAPSREKAELRNDIFQHGGRLALTTERDQDGVIKLAPEGATLPAGTKDYFSTHFIKDCVENDKKLKLENYRMCCGAKDTEFYSKSNLEYQKQLREEFDDLMPSKPLVTCQSKDLRGRKKYTTAEDREILKYIIENHKFNYVSGNCVWRSMENLQITDHTWQSMKDRYLKIIEPNIRSYYLPPKLAKKLQKFMPDYKIEGDHDVSIEEQSTGSDHNSDISVADEVLLEAEAKSAQGSEDGDESSGVESARVPSPSVMMTRSHRETVNSKGKSPLKAVHIRVKKVVCQDKSAEKPVSSEETSQDERIPSISIRSGKRHTLSTTENSADSDGSSTLVSSGDEDISKKRPRTRYAHSVPQQSKLHFTKSNSSNHTPGKSPNVHNPRTALSSHATRSRSSSNETRSRSSGQVAASSTNQGPPISPSRATRSKITHEQTSASPVSTTSGEMMTATEMITSDDDAGDSQCSQSQSLLEVSARIWAKLAAGEKTPSKDRGTSMDHLNGSQELDPMESSSDDGGEHIYLSRTETGTLFEELQSKYGIGMKEIKSVLWAFSGKIASATAFLDGVDLPFWTQEDDDNLRAGKNLHTLDKFSQTQKEARRAFLGLAENV